jgi:hypothetical protein
MQTLILQSSNTFDLTLLKELADRLNISYFFAELPPNYVIEDIESEEIMLADGVDANEIVPEMGISATETLDLFKQALAEPTLNFDEFKQVIQKWRKEQ